MPIILDLNDTSLPPFRFNSLLAILDASGNDTGARCYYVGLTGDGQGHLTGEAHVSLCDRRTLKRTPSNVNLPIHILRLASDLPSPVRKNGGGVGVGAEVQEQLLLPATETFVLSANCRGVIWQTADGWHGCLKFDIDGDTNFVGPFQSVVGARMAVRSEFTAGCAATPRDTAIVRGL